MWANTMIPDPTATLDPTQDPILYPDQTLDPDSKPNSQPRQSTPDPDRDPILDLDHDLRPFLEILPKRLGLDFQLDVSKSNR